MAEWACPTCGRRFARTNQRHSCAVQPVTSFFRGHPEAETLFRAVRDAIVEVGGAEVTATKAQVEFRHRRGFAWVWMPGAYLSGDTAPLVLTVDLRRRDASPRWKEVVEVRPGRFAHHLELRRASQIDDEVRAWLREARETA